MITENEDDDGMTAGELELRERMRPLCGEVRLALDAKHRNALRLVGRLEAPMPASSIGAACWLEMHQLDALQATRPL